MGSFTVIQLLLSRACFREVAHLLVVSYDDAFSLKLWRSLHRNALVSWMNPYFLVLIQLIRHLRLTHVVVLDVYCVAQISNLRCILKVIWHCHLGRDGRLALDTLNDFPLWLLVAAHAVESLRDGRVHPLIAHLLKSTLLRPRCILKRVLLSPKLLLLNYLIVAIINKARDNVIILVAIIILINARGRALQVTLIRHHVV